jgi:Sel1 repeat
MSDAQLVKPEDGMHPIMRWYQNHPTQHKRTLNRKIVTTVFLHPFNIRASLSIMNHWEYMFCGRTPLKAHPQQWSVYNIIVSKKKQVITLLTRTTMCNLLVLKLMGFRDVHYGSRIHHSRRAHHLAKCVVSRFHFFGQYKNQAEDLFQEGKRSLAEDGHDFDRRLEMASLLHHGESYALLSIYDRNRSFKYAIIGTNTGCTHSRGTLGGCYLNGEGVSRDVVKGIALARDSAAAGSSYGQFVLANCYERGIGVSQDNEEAVRLYRLSVEQGNVWAMKALGYMFMHGKGVAQDNVEAARLFRLANTHYKNIARYELDKMVSDGRA